VRFEAVFYEFRDLHKVPFDCGGNCGDFSSKMANIRKSGQNPKSAKAVRAKSLATLQRHAEIDGFLSFCGECLCHACLLLHNF